MDMLLEQFKVLIDRPEKVKKLRELILQLAVRGKLVDQNENDEPAAVLLERIREEKERLVKERKIKKEKPLPEISEEEKPYELPMGWEWIRIKDAGYNLGQKKPDNKFSYIDVGSINKELGILGDEINIIEPENAPSRARKLVDFGTVIYSTVRPYLLNIAIIDREFLYEPIVSTAFAIIHPYSVIINKFIFYYLRSKIFIEYVESQMVGMAYPAINDEKFFNGLIPLPPLNEQKRIVEKVGSLMIFCDKLEKELERKIKYSYLSSKSVFNSIGNCSSAEELEETLSFIIDNFKEFTLGDGAIKELQNAILQLAVQGKLVPQVPEDEPASVLLEKMRCEKERLIYEGKLKKEKPLPEISEEEKHYKIPLGWEWIRLGDYTILNPRNNVDDTLDTSFIPMKLIDDGFSNKHESEVKLWSEIKSGFTHFAEEDVVVAKITPCFENRKSAVMKNLVNNCGAGTTELYVVRSILGLIIPEYLLSIFKTETFIKGGVDTYTGTAGQQRVKKDYINNLVIALPPLNEQKRIVEKVNLLMAICDELERRIEKSKKYSEKLLEALLKKTFKA